MKKPLSFLWIVFLLTCLLGFPGRAVSADLYFATHISDIELTTASTEVSGEASESASGPTLFAGTERPSGEMPAGFMDRFEQKQTSWGFQIGYGFTTDLPPPPEHLGDRTDIEFLYLFPNWKYNLTGLVGKGAWRGALYWVVEAGLALAVTDPEFLGQPQDDAPSYVLGLVPFQLEYKFISPDRRWVPFIFGGAGASVGDFNRGAREISTQFEFILNTGAGIEYYFKDGPAVSFNYHFWHLSNSGIKAPNIGLNAHVFTLGFSF